MQRFLDAVLRIVTFGFWRRRKSATIIGFDGRTTITLDSNPFNTGDSIVIEGNKIKEWPYGRKA